jgi:hypothetical protein
MRTDTLANSVPSCPERGEKMPESTDPDPSGSGTTDQLNADLSNHSSMMKIMGRNTLA